MAKKRRPATVRRPQPEAPPEAAPDHQKLPPLPPGVPVVGIGASAGGLDPIKNLVAALPADCGLAFVVIQHLDPTHESHLAELLARQTALPVTLADHGTPIEANHIYTIPPDRFVAVEDDKLVLREPVTLLGRRLPIDYFFSSLAGAREERAIGIVLSGTGSDGTQGARAIRRAGGLVMAQDPQTAQYGDMPRSAIATGLVDFVLPVEQMVRALLDYVRKALPAVAAPQPPGLPEKHVSDILGLIQVHTRCDFRDYKRNTLLRRILRRMGLKQIADSAAYVEHLRHAPDEVRELRKDLLIGVTGFFREPDAFEELCRLVVAPLVAEKTPDVPIRVWVPGCATGEEAYSLAMLFHEELEKAGKYCPLQVFASDIDEAALESARAGVYSPDSVLDIGEPFRRKYLGKAGANSLVAKPIREAVVFSVQNLISDPPFSKLDLVSCRNVLIYLQPEVQKKTISLFAFALNPGGHLFLGKSEGISGREDLFDPVSKTGRIYRRRVTARPEVVDFPIVRPVDRASHALPHAEAPKIPRPAALALINQEVLLEHYQAAMVLVDTRGKILHCFGDASRYLRLPTGEADLDLLKMARDRLSLKLRPALHRVLQGQDLVRLAAVPVRRDGKTFRVSVTLRMLRPEGWKERLVAVLFEDVRAPATARQAVREVEDDPGLRELEADLKATKDELQTTYEQFETSAEELKAANEEVMSMNEELQSANEELETSKEELQSINEELTTVNAQLSEKLDELSTANNDLANLLNATPVATVFLDTELRVKRFTAKATDLFHLIPGDVGRPIDHISPRFAGADVITDARAVLKDLGTTDREIRTERAWYAVRSFPYRTVENRIEGVVITFLDVTRFKLAEELETAVLECVAHPVAILDERLAVLAANAPFLASFGYDRKDLPGTPLAQLGHGEWDVPEVRSALEDVLAGRQAIEERKIRLAVRGGAKALRLRARPAGGAGPAPRRVVLSVHLTEE